MSAMITHLASVGVLSNGCKGTTSSNDFPPPIIPTHKDKLNGTNAPSPPFSGARCMALTLPNGHPYCRHSNLHSTLRTTVPSAVHLMSSCLVHHLLPFLLICVATLFPLSILLTPLQFTLHRCSVSSARSGRPQLSLWLPIIVSLLLVLLPPRPHNPTTFRPAPWP